MRRRLGQSEGALLVVKGNLATTYDGLGRLEEALPLRHEVFSEFVKRIGVEDERTLASAMNYACTLRDLDRRTDATGQPHTWHRSQRAKFLLRKLIPVARRVLGEGHEQTIRMRLVYAMCLSDPDAAPRDDVAEATTLLEELLRTAQRIYGPANPLVKNIKETLEYAQKKLTRLDRRLSTR